MIEFTHAAYRKLLSWLKERGFHVGAFRETGREERFVILRHDIDFSPAKALEMARMDHDAGCTATFFVLLTSPYYNALSRAALAIFREISSLGHELGLHLDFTGFDVLNPAQQQEKVKLLAACFGDAVGQRITVVSQHKPTTSGIRIDFPDFSDAYSDRFFKEIGYISDSRMQFQENDVYGFFEQRPKSQMLIHPLWWNPARIDRREVFERLAVSFGDSCREGLAEEERVIEQWLTDHFQGSHRP